MLSGGMIGILWLAQTILFAATVAFGWRDPAKPGAEARIALPVRLGLSFSLVLAALWIASLDGAHGGYRTWAAAGMALGFVGDLAMANLLPIPNRFLGGMVAFGLGHAFYIVAATAAADSASVPLVGSVFLAGLAMYSISNLIAWFGEIRLLPRPAAVRHGALVYGLGIGVMAAAMLSLAGQIGGAWWVAAAGGMIFMISDLLIALTEIGERQLRHSHDWIWGTYLAGQMGIVYAGWLAA